MRKSCSRWNSRVKGSFWSYPAGCDGGPGLENLKSSHRKLRVSLRRWGTRSWSRRPRWWGARSAGTVERRDLLGGPTAPARPRALTVRAGFSRAPPRPVTWQPPHVHAGRLATPHKPMRVTRRHSVSEFQPALGFPDADSEGLLVAQERREGAEI